MNEVAVAVGTRGFPPYLDNRIIGRDESYWSGLTALLDNGLLLRFKGGRSAGSYWTFAIFLDSHGTVLRPAYAEVQRWTGQHRSARARAYLTPRASDASTRSSLDTLANRLDTKWTALILMERKPKFVDGPSDARWTIDVRFFAQRPVERTANLVAGSLHEILGALAHCSTERFAPWIRGES